jgi:hypothetical protein
MPYAMKGCISAFSEWAMAIASSIVSARGVSVESAPTLKFLRVE